MDQDFITQNATMQPAQGVIVVAQSMFGQSQELPLPACARERASKY